jgi:hypothetical protein
MLGFITSVNKISGAARRAYNDRQAVAMNDGYTPAQKAALAAVMWNGQQVHGTTPQGIARGIMNRLVDQAGEIDHSGTPACVAT